MARKKKRPQKTDSSKTARPSALAPVRKAPKEARRILFRRDQGPAAPRADKEDIIVVLNRALAQSKLPDFVRVVDAGYSSTGAITVLLEKEALGSMLVPSYDDLLITAVRQAHAAVISVELPEQWY